MQLRLIRNATLVLQYAGKRILLDPFAAEQGSLPAFVDKAPNPTAPLPCNPDAFLDGNDLVLISHLHPDHFDEISQQQLDKRTPLVCQPPDEEAIRKMGFEQVHVLQDTLAWGEIEVTRTPGQHGTGEWIEKMGPVSGFVLEGPNEPKVYIAGDTIWYEPVDKAITTHKPDVIVTNSGGATFDGSPIIMDIEQTLQVCQAAPQATVVAVHLESLDHCPVSRAALREAGQGMKLLVPEDGEELRL